MDTSLIMREEKKIAVHVKQGKTIILRPFGDFFVYNPVFWSIMGFLFGPVALPFVFLDGKKSRR
jgi:hypothetical protein